VQLQLYDYPNSAVRELVVNALVHRDYQVDGSVDLEHSPEQLVVSSPGGLVFGVTPENILTHPIDTEKPASPGDSDHPSGR